MSVNQELSIRSPVGTEQSRRGGPRRRDRPVRTGMRLLVREVRPVRGLTAAALAVLIVSVLATLVGPLFVQDFVDLATGGGTAGELVPIALAYLGFAVLAGVTRVAASFLGVQCGWRIADSIRIRLLRRVCADTPILELEGRPVGEVLEKVEGNADVVGRSIAASGFGLLGNVVVAVGALLVMLLQVPAAGIGVTVLVVVVYVVLARLSRIAVRRWTVARNQQADLFGLVGDSLGARDDLLPSGESHWATGRVRSGLADLYRTEGSAYIGGRAFWPVTQMFVALAFGLGVGFGLQRLEMGLVGVGTLTLLFLYVDLMQKPLEEMSSQAGQLQQMLAVLAIAARTLDDGPAPPAPVRPVTGPDLLPAGPLPVTFEDVTFAYGDRPVLHGVSFGVPAGRSLGIVGRTGAGKSTIVNLLCGLAAPATGRVRIGGVDACDIPAAEFARRVTVMSQRAQVFGASVRENVTLFDDAVGDEQVWAVLEQLDATAWVRALPEGLHTRIGSGGRSLSEGEQQVLAGARALMRPYSLLIVDEGTSRLDPDSERSWVALLDTVMRDRTVVIVEHRWGTLRSVDEALVVEDGRVAEVLTGQPAVAAWTGRQ